MKKITRSILLAFKLYKGYWKYLVLSSVVGGTVFFARPLIGPLFIQNIFDHLSDHNMTAMNTVAILGVAFLFLLLAAGYLLIVYADAWAIYLISSGCISLFKTVYDKKTNEYSLQFPPEDQFTRITQGSDAPSSVIIILIQCFAMTASTMIMLWSLYAMSPVIFVFALLFLLLECTGIIIQMRKSYTVQQRIQAGYANFNGSIENIVQNIDQLLFLDECELATHEVYDAQFSLWKSKISGNRIQCVMNFYDDMIFSLLKGTVFSSLGGQGQFSIGGTGSINSLLESFRQSSSTTIQFGSEIPDYLAKSDRVFDLLSQSAELKESAAPDDIPAGAIVLDQATVYRGHTVILDNVTCTIAKGDKVALIGGNGSGKTTFIQALLGNRSLYSGKILIESYDAVGLNHLTRRGIIGYIPVDCQLYSVSARENIHMGLLGHDDVWLPAGDDFFDKPADILSAGQKRRVNILRAVEKHPRVLVADEPDSDLDYDQAQKYYDYILSFAETVVVVTHDSRFLSKFDYCLKLENAQLSKIQIRDNVKT